MTKWTESQLNEISDGTVIVAHDGTWALACGWDEYDWDENWKEIVKHERRWAFFGSDITFYTNELVEEHGFRWMIVEVTA